MTSIQNTPSEPGAARCTPMSATMTRTTSQKGLAALLLAAIVAALVAAADSVVDSYADGHLLLGWITLWAVGFAALALFADSARKAAARLTRLFGGWTERRAQRRCDAQWRALAEKDPRIMADLQAAMERAQAEQQKLDQAMGRAWLARHPVGTFSAAYQGPRPGFRTTPLAGLPTHLQYLPG